MPRRQRRLWLVSALTLAALSLPAASAAPSLRGAKAPTPDAAKVCSGHLKQIGRALAVYRRQHRALPNHLSDLHPRFLRDRAVLHCPADPSLGSPAYQGGSVDPRMPVSYLYEMSLARNPGGLLLGPGPSGPRATWRAQKLSQQYHYGDRVPVVRCWNHMIRPVAGASPFVLNLTTSGQVYRSNVYWEEAPDTVAVVLTRLEKDVRAGYSAVRRHWHLPQVGAYFSQASVAPMRRARCRALARRLTELQEGSGGPDYDLWIASSGLYRAAGALDDAIDVLEPLPQLGQREEYAIPALAELYGATGRHEKATALLEEAVAGAPGNPRYMELLAQAYSRAGQHEKAAEWRRKADPGERVVGRLAPDFTLKDPSGGVVQLQNLRGKVVFLNFWASW